MTDLPMPQEPKEPQEPQKGQKTPFPGATAAVALGVVLLTGFGVLGWLTALDRQERTSLEALEEPSAAGAPSLKLPPGAEPGPDSIPVLSKGGVPHYGEDIANHSDGTMMKAGHDDSGQIALYQRIRRNKRKKELYVKLAPGRFLEVAPKDEKDEGDEGDEGSESRGHKAPEPKDKEKKAD